MVVLTAENNELGFFSSLDPFWQGPSSHPGPESDVPWYYFGSEEAKLFTSDLDLFQDSANSIPLPCNQDNEEHPGDNQSLDTVADLPLYVVPPAIPDISISNGVTNDDCYTSSQNSLNPMFWEKSLNSEPAPIPTYPSNPVLLHETENDSSYEPTDLSSTETKLCVLPEKPITKRKRSNNQWTESENRELIALVEKYSGHNWKQISRELSTNRSEGECRQHYCRVLKRSTAGGRWKDDEVTRLQEAVTLFSDWKQIADMVATRDASQCKQKWERLNTNKKCARGWTPEEHAMMMRLYEQYPNQWKKISEQLSFKVNAEQVRTHYITFRRDLLKTSLK